MIYTKPQMVALPDALSSIQSTPLLKGPIDVFDALMGALQRDTISAYEGDE